MHELAVPGSRVLAAVSGGPDSMAMLSILHRLAGELGLTLAAAHFDHRIRSSSKRDAALVGSYCARLGVELLSGSGDVPARSKASAEGIEESARVMRYRFLENTAQQWRAAAVALGHTRDDQVETILHHMIRGSGWRGLAGMPVKRGPFVRPVLCCEHGELKSYLRAMGIRYAIDQSNNDNSFLRNRIRNRLIPMLKREFNPSIDDSIIRIGDNILEGWEALAGPAENAGAAMDDGPGIAIPLEGIENLPDFHLYLVIDRVLRDHFGVIQDIGKTHYDAARKLVRAGRSGSRTQFPHGVTLLREQRAIRFLPGGAAAPEPPAPRAILPGEGTFPLPSRNCSVVISRIDPAGKEMRASETEAFFHGLTFPVTVRNRLPGDRIVPFGMRGRRKLGDIFTDRKIPAHLRRLAAVFEDDRGIFWVPGIVTSERARVGPRAKTALHIRLVPENE